MKKLILAFVILATTTYCSSPDVNDNTDNSFRNIENSTENNIEESSLTNENDSMMAPLNCIEDYDFGATVITGTYDIKFYWDFSNSQYLPCEDYQIQLQIETFNGLSCPPYGTTSEGSSSFTYNIPSSDLGSINAVGIPHSTLKMKLFRYRLVINGGHCDEYGNPCQTISDWKCYSIFA